jgi:hypothetical protein
MVRLGRYRLNCLLLAVVAAAQCGCTIHEYVDNPESDGVEAAVDGESCRLLAERESQGKSRTADARYKDAIDRGTIIEIKNRTNVERVEELFFEDGRFVSEYPTTGMEMIAKRIVVVLWVIPRSGAYAGRKVCVTNGIRNDSPPPL